MKKYEPLTNHLARRTEGEWKASFTDLEAVLGFSLPKAAHTSGAWWANEGLKPHNLAWIDAGWKASEVDRKGQSVVFRRLAAAAPAEVVLLGEAENTAPEASRKAKVGATALIAGSVALVAGLGALAVRAVRRGKA